MTLRFEQSRRTPVYSRDSADEIGHVVRFVITPGAHRVGAVHVAGRKPPPPSNVGREARQRTLARSPRFSRPHLGRRGRLRSRARGRRTACGR
jgi:hypothetical protein